MTPSRRARATVIEATKTEPDKNTYLNIDGQGGADASYDYGTHFLFQGHENGSPGNLMCQTSNANPMPGSTGLNSDQIDDIEDADDMVGPC